MAFPPDFASSDIEQLLQRGLDYFGRDLCSEAIDCWKEVCRREPGHADALDYLESAGVDVEALQAELEAEQKSAQDTELDEQATTGVTNVVSLDSARARATESAPAPPNTTALGGVECQEGTLDCQRIERLLHERRYEEVLTLLYAARKRAPKDASISRSIRHVRERLSNEYAYRLVDMDRVPRPVGGKNLAAALAGADWRGVDRAVARDARQLAGLIDGISSFADIAAASPLGQLSTLRALCTLLERSHIHVAPADGTSKAPSARPAGAENSAPPARAPSTPAAQPEATPEPLAGRHRDVSGPIPVNVAQDASSPVPTADPFDVAFKAATEAYLLRDFERAIELFSECLRHKPGDRRSLHNLEALMRRTRKA